MEKRKNGGKTMRKEYFVVEYKAYLFAFLLMIPIILVSTLPYWFIWGTDCLGNLDFKSLKSYFILFITLFIISIAVHELIHGLSWCCFTKNGWKSIKFGIIWNQLMPYCHCNEALTAHQYRIGLLMPTVVLGVIPIIIAWITGSVFLLLYGTVMIVSGAGDLLMYGIMFKVDGSAKVKDHPKKIGFTIEEE